MITFESTGDFKKTDSFLARLLKKDISSVLDRYGKAGVSALSSATPKDSGRAATSWGYKVEHSAGSYSIIWTNNDIENGFPVVIALQYGHGTGTGGWVQGRDFINPAIKPIMDQIATAVWKEVVSV